MICTPKQNFSVEKVDKFEIGGTCSAYGEEGRRIQVREPEGKRPLGRPRRR
jgi:hypothetical protein